MESGGKHLGILVCTQGSLAKRERARVERVPKVHHADLSRPRFWGNKTASFFSYIAVLQLVEMGGLLEQHGVQVE